MVKDKKRNYAKENAWEDQPEQVARRMARNRARAAAMRKGLVKKGDSKEVDHLGFNRKGDLNNKKVKVVTRKANRSRQPKRDGSND